MGLSEDKEAARIRSAMEIRAKARKLTPVDHVLRRPHAKFGRWRLLATALAGHMQTVTRAPDVVAIDRGLGTNDNEARLREAGAKRISPPY